MIETSVFKLSNFVTKCTKNIFLYESEMMDTISKSQYSLREVLDKSKLKGSIIPLSYIQDQINVWNEVLKRKDELDEFFTNIYNNDDFEKCLSTTIPIYDVGEVQAIRPQYLTQYLKKSFKTIDTSIKDSKSVDGNEFCSSKQLDILKKSVVSSRYPKYFDQTNFLKIDTKKVVHVNSSYITNVMLPFIRSADYETKNMIDNANNAISVIENSILQINDAITAFNKIFDDIDNPIFTYKLLSRMISNFLNASKYMIASIMRKIYIYTANMKEYCGLKDGIMDTFQNGDDILHESVMDGSYDFRDEDIVLNMLNGRSDITDSVIQRVFSKFRAYLSEYQPRELGDDFHSLIDLEIENAPFDIQLYKKMLGMEKSIYDITQSIIKLSDDPELSIEDIQSNSGLNQSILNTFSDTLLRVSNTSAYDAVDGVSEYNRCMSILNELLYAQKFFPKFSGNVKNIYDDFSEFKKSIQRNENDKYENHERNKEEILFLESFEKDFRQLLLQLGRNYLNRIMELEDILIHNESSISGIAPEQLDIDYSEDYISDALATNEDIDTSIIEACCANTLYEFEKVLMENSITASPINFFEDGEQPAQNQQNTSSTNNEQQGNNNSQNTQSPKPSVVDNSGNQTDNSGKNNGLSGVLQSLRDFLSGIVKKISTAIGKGKSNLSWIDENEESLRNRSYTNVSINVVPYDENVSYSKLINDCSAEINNWKSNPIGKTEEQVMQKMLKTLPKAIKKNKDGSWDESLVNALKYGNGEVGKTITYSDSAIVPEVGKMIDYCKNYYTRFDKDIQAATTTIEEAIKDLDNKNPDNKKVGDGMSPQETITFMLKTSSTLTSIIAGVARDRVNDYLSILKDLVPNKNKNNNQNNQQNTNNQNNNNNPM